ncbi:hypothetical protein OAI16_04335 [Flavobacteriaceae bacterium]|nr:hypothetical protein [Flavobacteriaceae bacterium]MDC0117107.1 hypothetical protein [Flavobacteriaceae bacterium]
MNNINKKSLFNFVIDLKYKDRSSPEFKNLLSLFIRDITERNQKYKITDLLKNTLKEYNLYQSDEIKMSQMRSLNRQLKKSGYKSNKSAIQLEHWKEVKKMRDELLNINLKNDIDEAICQIETYFLNQTSCFFKLTEKEWNLQPNKTKP